MKLRLSSAIVGLSLLLLLPALSRADDIYTFTESITGGASVLVPSTFGWSFDVPSILTTTTTIPSTSLFNVSLTGVVSSDGCTISSVKIINPATTYSVQTDFASCPSSVNQVNAASPITGVGTYGFTTANNIQSNTLTVTAPEPSSLVFLGLGLVALLGWAKFKALAA